MPKHYPHNNQHRQRRNTGIFLSAVILGMLGLAYASVPLYRMFCQKTGFGGTTQVALNPAPGAIGQKFITIRFNADVAKNLPWEFTPLQKEVKIRPGEQGFAMYRCKNKTDRPISGMSTYNVTPDKTGIFFNKIECFCFIKQTLQPHQEVDMPVLFYIDPSILDDVSMQDVDTITLSYTFFQYDDET